MSVISFVLEKSVRCREVSATKNVRYQEVSLCFIIWSMCDILCPVFLETSNKVKADQKKFKVHKKNMSSALSSDQ